MNTDFKECPLQQFGDSRWRHAKITEGQQQAIMLALAKLSNERPGWETFIACIAMKFPGGLKQLRWFQQEETEKTLNAISTIGEPP